MWFYTHTLVVNPKFAFTRHLDILRANKKHIAFFQVEIHLPNEEAPSLGSRHSRISVLYCADIDIAVYIFGNRHRFMFNMNL